MSGGGPGGIFTGLKRSMLVVTTTLTSVKSHDLVLTLAGKQQISEVQNMKVWEV